MSLISSEELGMLFSGSCRVLVVSKQVAKDCRQFSGKEKEVIKLGGVDGGIKVGPEIMGIDKGNVTILSSSNLIIF